MTQSQVLIDVFEIIKSVVLDQEETERQRVAAIAKISESYKNGKDKVQPSQVRVVILSKKTLAGTFNNDSS